LLLSPLPISLFPLSSILLPLLLLSLVPLFSFFLLSLRVFVLLPFRTWLTAAGAFRPVGLLSARAARLKKKKKNIYWLLPQAENEPIPFGEFTKNFL